jgi:hypothetical protein
MSVIDRIDMLLEVTKGSTDDAYLYIKKIKNKEKKRYAQDWLKACENGTKMKDSDYHLSAMAKQAVRMSLSHYGIEGGDLE